MTAAAAVCAWMALGCADRSAIAEPGLAADEVIQSFPVGQSMETAWKVQWAHGTSKGLYITGAWFKSAPGKPWMRILYDARLADIFVPYHSGSPRFYDLTGFNFGLLEPTPNDAGCCGTLLGSPPVAVKEVRDYGMAWKDDQAGHRGQELVLWATLDAANYNYIMEYRFRDDGTIAFGLGATARNLPGRETEAHMHDGLWRIDIDLAGAANDAALVVRHVEPAGSQAASDLAARFNGGVEGFADWNSREFKHLRVEDTQVTNARGRSVSYDLVPVRRGTPRHAEAWSQHDFWVTREKPSEIFYSQLPTYVSNGESITNADIVLWHVSPVHHQPRDEDGRSVDGVWQGVALTMWGGFELRPRNLFDETPLHP